MGEMADIDAERAMQDDGEDEARHDHERVQQEAHRALSEPFDPVKYITSIKGKAYLEAKWRIAWFRDKHPEGRIDTQMVNLWGMDTSNPFVLFKATVSTGDGGVAVGHKTEEKDHFDDFIEKAETGAIGRALAALGFGTQFATELDEGTVSDSPINTSRTYAPSDIQSRTMGSGSYQSGGGSRGPSKPSEKQWESFNNIVKRNGIDAIMLVKDLAGVDHPEKLTGGREGTMSTVLDALFAISRNERMIEQHWLLDNTPAAPGPVPYKAAANPHKPPAGVDPKTNFRANIERARSAQQLDAIYKGMTTAGLDQDEELLLLMSEVQARIEAGS